jgi:hypothetical protein
MKNLFFIISEISEKQLNRKIIGQNLKKKKKKKYL